MQKTAKEKHKFLLTSPAYFVGSSNSSEIKVLHVFDSIFNSEKVPSSRYVIDRSHHLVIFETDPKPDEIAVPNYYPVGEIVSQVMSVFFGKLVAPAGFIESGGILCVPEHVDCGQYDKFFPFYSDRVRSTFPEKLERQSLEKIDFMHLSEEFICASRLYQCALLQYMTMPDIAYLNLVNAGETLTKNMEIPTESLFPHGIMDKFKEIEEHCPNGKKIVKEFQFLLRQIKRKYVSGLSGIKQFGLFSNEFDAQSQGSIISRLSEEDFDEAISASYNLRSKVLHEGVRIGSSVSFWRTEVGLPFNRSMSEGLIRILNKAPSFVCLERIIRCALLTKLYEDCNLQLPSMSAKS